MAREETATRDLVLLGLFPCTGQDGTGGDRRGRRRPRDPGARFLLGFTGSTCERKRLLVLLPRLVRGEERDLGRDTAL